MTCDEVREQLAEHLLDTLDETSDLRVRRHLRACATCRGETAALAQGIDTLARAVQVDPPPQLRTRVLGVLDEEWNETKPRPAAAPATPLRVWVLRVAAAVVLIASLGAAAVQTQRASHFGAQAAAYDEFLHVLGGSAVRVGQLHPATGQDVQGSLVLYDSMVGQSWALVLVRAPGLNGEVDVTLSSDTRTIQMRSLYVGASGEASSWLVTSADLTSFDHVTLTDAATGAVIATGSTNT